jgi:hypothetical protein
VYDKKQKEIVANKEQVGIGECQALR